LGKEIVEKLRRYEERIFLLHTEVDRLSGILLGTETNRRISDLNMVSYFNSDTIITFYHCIPNVKLFQLLDLKFLFYLACAGFYF
jgi:hypothetical protein